MKLGKRCSVCGDTASRLSRCETGHICDNCLARAREGRDTTTRWIKEADSIVTIEGVQEPRLIEIDIKETEGDSRKKAIMPVDLPASLTPAIVAQDAAAHRNQLLAALGNECVALALDLEISMKAENRVETLLLHQMAAAHNAAMQSLSRAFLADEPADQVRYANVSARMMDLFQRGAADLQRLRSKGQQQILVQHVTVAEGGQAIVGNVKAGGGE